MNTLGVGVVCTEVVDYSDSDQPKPSRALQGKHVKAKSSREWASDPEKTGTAHAHC